MRITEKSTVQDLMAVLLTENVKLHVEMGNFLLRNELEYQRKYQGYSGVGLQKVTSSDSCKEQKKALQKVVMSDRKLINY